MHALVLDRRISADLAKWLRRLTCTIVRKGRMIIARSLSSGATPLVMSSRIDIRRSSVQLRESAAQRMQCVIRPVKNRNEGKAKSLGTRWRDHGESGGALSPSSTRRVPQLAFPVPGALPELVKGVALKMPCVSFGGSSPSRTRIFFVCGQFRCACLVFFCGRPRLRRNAATSSVRPPPLCARSPLLLLLPVSLHTTQLCYHPM